jgi:hypothetical protein
MKEYHKIQSVFKRDPATRNKHFLMGEFADPAFEYLQNCVWNWTEKVDGTNIRVMWDGEEVTFGGKTDRAQIPATLVNVLQAQFTPERFKAADAPPMCLYGEGYGAKIQKGGGNYRPDPGFVLFDVKVDEWWLTRENVADVAEKLQTDVVPVVGAGTITDAVKLVSLGFNSQWGEFPAEGIVLRPRVQLFNRRGERVITKLKHKDFV